MKKNIVKLMSVAVCALVSCEAMDNAAGTVGMKQAQLEIAVDTGDSADVKAPFVSSETYESQVNEVQILVFDEKGRLNAYKSTKSTEDITITTTYGTKTVWAVVNGPDLASVKTLSGLTGTALDLSSNSISADKGFVMSGSASVTVDKSYVPASIDVRRLTARVAVCNIVNRLPSAYPDMTVESIVLTNVVGNQNIAGSAPVSTWYNKAGRQDGGDMNSIIDGTSYKASCPDLTLKKPGETIVNGSRLEKTYCFYSYPNNTAADVPGWTNPFTPRKTRLVVTAVISGEKYYYPVVMESLERNKAYTVNMTITALGSSDPDKKVEKGTISATVIVKPWDPGAEYTETI